MKGLFLCLAAGFCLAFNSLYDKKLLLINVHVFYIIALKTFTAVAIVSAILLALKFAGKAPPSSKIPAYT